MTSTNVAVLIAAAGSGERLGRGPKAFVSVRGHALLALCRLVLDGLVSETVVALPAAHVAAYREAHGGEDGLTVVAGGATRQDSVAAMLAATTAQIVLVHDVARPFLTPSVIHRVVSAAAADGAATAALDVADTVFDIAAGSTLDRSNLRLVQTPQGFDRRLLAEAHAAARAAGATATDDAELVRRLGRRVALVQGSRLLHKLTGPEDLAVAEVLFDLWLAERARVPAGG